MNKEQFNQIWERSGLGDYYRRMSELEKVGFTFQDDCTRSMDHFQSLALTQYIEDKNLDKIDYPIETIKEDFEAIMKLAGKLRREQEDTK